MCPTFASFPHGRCRSRTGPKSRPVKSRQTGPHPRLEQIVSKHLGTVWRAPLHRPTEIVFARLLELLDDGEQSRLILDSGCGTGVSTDRLGQSYPRNVVVGIDRSAARLARYVGRSLPLRRGNRIWIRAELASLWRLGVAHGWRLRRHFLLYPNPWPKAAHLKRRWHAHPAFPALLQLGGELEMRCNWRVFAQEFAVAAELATGRRVPPEKLAAEAPLSPFEAKYQASGHDLYRLRIDLTKKKPRLPGA